MAKLSDEKIAELKRAAARARMHLKPGDTITFTSCPGTKRWAIFTGFVHQRDWICTKTRDDVHAISITKVNGIPTDFSDARGMPFNPAGYMELPQGSSVTALSDEDLPF